MKTTTDSIRQQRISRTSIAQVKLTCTLLLLVLVLIIVVSSTSTSTSTIRIISTVSAFSLLRLLPSNSINKVICTKSFSWQQQNHNNHYHFLQRQSNNNLFMIRDKSSTMIDTTGTSVVVNNELEITEETTDLIDTSTSDEQQQQEQQINDNTNISYQRRSFPTIQVTKDTILLPKQTSAAPITNEIRQIQEQITGPIVSNFQIHDNFNPFLKNGHLQTIIGYKVRPAIKTTCMYIQQATSTNPIAPTIQIIQSLLEANNVLNDKKKDKNHDETKMNDFWDHREKVLTPDGDWFHADTKYATTTTTCTGSTQEDYTTMGNFDVYTNKNIPTVLLLHGLNSNSNSPVSIDMAKAFVNAGMNCICLNFRGCSGIPNDTLRFYHLGFTEDIQYYIKLYNERFLFKQQQQRSTSTSTKKDMVKPILYLAGFSLGANVVLKCLGEYGVDAITKYNVHGAVTICAPLDNVRNTITLGKFGINKFVYTYNLLNGLKNRATIALNKFCNSNTNTYQFDYIRGMLSTTIPQFDDSFTSHIYNYDNCWDYYSQTSSIYYLNSIIVPTLLLNAKDDPFFDNTVWPGSDPRLTTVPTNIMFYQSQYGGHLGFTTHQVPYNDDTNNDTSTKTLQSSSSSSSSLPSWASVQVANFLRHVQSQTEMIQLQIQQQHEEQQD